MIGSLGSIIFQVSDQSFLSFSDLSFSRSANFADHKIIAANTLLEFTGFSPAACSVKIILDSSLGVIPSEQLKDLQDMFDSHEAQLFVLDGKLVGSGDWVIESFNTNIERVNNFGRIERASVSLSLKEYY